MKKAQLLRKSRLFVIPAVLAGVIGAAQVGTTSNGCLDPNKCYKLIYHPT
jgi:hypothetical protein